MATLDFYADAVDCLKFDTNGEYMIFYAQPGMAHCHFSIHCSSPQVLDWFEQKIKIGIKQFRDMNEDPE